MAGLAVVRRSLLPGQQQQAPSGLHIIVSRADWRHHLSGSGKIEHSLCGWLASDSVGAEAGVSCEWDEERANEMLPSRETVQELKHDREVR